jgi:hypothetical protein
MKRLLCLVLLVLLCVAFASDAKAQVRGRDVRRGGFRGFRGGRTIVIQPVPLIAPQVVSPVYGGALGVADPCAFGGLGVGTCGGVGINGVNAFGYSGLGIQRPIVIQQRGFGGRRFFGGRRGFGGRGFGSRGGFNFGRSLALGILGGF